MKKTFTLKKNYEFVRIYKRGRSFAGKYMVIYVLRNRYGTNRIGITANKKVGISVKRNRAKRLIREGYRFYEDFIPTGLDIVFVARTINTKYGLAAILKEMKFLLKKVKAFDQEKWDGLKKS